MRTTRYYDIIPWTTIVFESFFRRVWRWHFWTGLLACPVLLVVALTGAMYTFRDDIEDWQQAEVRFVEPRGERQSVSEQLVAVKAAYPTWTPTRVVLSGDAKRTTLVQVERPDAPPGAIWAVSVNPYSAEVIGEGEGRSPFFAGVLKLHRTLFAGTTGRIAVELTTSWTLVLLVSGFFLWWPKAWNRIRGVWLPRLTAKPYTVWRDLHSLAGIYLLPVLALIAFTGLFFTVVWLPLFNGATNGAGTFPNRLRNTASSGKAESGKAPVAIDEAIDTARRSFPDHSLTLQLPKKSADTYAFTARNGRGPSVSGVIAIDRYSGAVLSETHAEDLPITELARAYVLPIHMGTIAGTPTKIVAIIACLASAGLGVSGIAMWLVRRPAGRFGFPRASAAQVPKAAVILILLLGAVLPTVGASLVLVVLGEWLFLRLSRPKTDPFPAEAAVGLSPVSVPQEVS